MKNVLKIMGLLPMLCLNIVMAAGGADWVPHDKFPANMSNSESIQRGAKYYVNYCLACHSLEFQRYNRIGMDTGLDEDVIKDNLIFTGQSVSQTMLSAIPDDDAQEWFGKVPPDLSLISRSKGSDYVYNYLRAFYRDDSKPMGVNNGVFPDVGMPHVLASVEGVKEAIYDETEQCKTVDGESVCETHKTLAGYTAPVGGTVSPDEYDAMVFDLSQFLYYVSDPSEIKRHRIGPWVLGFLILMTFVLYLLKREYWRDIH
ncbi:cytochrome c1 [Ostreibacterium oceani]|uniref:Cytochrome c1 n=1 Tax=Ostreibacterium oceani TaxID=2654998 RepID=A0A6N7EZY2_9GAMM|nr:cytochrome c1 [Ostreibacterium oceani]MPV86697.1 cytochrome c1 [Ostreibacterium oceani]